MNEVSIKVNIAGRIYPLTVDSSQEPNIRNAEKKIEESLNVFQQNYAVKDKQDLLAMAALQVASAPAQAPEKIIEKVVERIEVPVPVSMDAELNQLESLLDQYLS
jgi:cell division protein ZapA (FtsZ GTPase activity inhibitor)